MESKSASAVNSLTAFTSPYMLATILLLSGFLSLFLVNSFGWRQGALFSVGLSAGVILYHAAFGFTSAWREVVRTGRGAGLRAQMIMLALTVLVFTPLIAQGELFGVSLRGSVAPLNFSVVCGAFMFGLGMQLGGGCASGTLYTAGGGNTRMLITLIAFIAGSVLGTWQWPIWQDTMGLAPISLSQSFGLVGGILISFVIFAGVWYISILYEKSRNESIITEPRSGFSTLRGPWPLLAGALALVFIQVATLLLAGRPWGVTSAFALWGAKAVGSIGLDVSVWPYWSRPGPLNSLHQSIFSDVTTIMNLGIILGAAAAANLARKFSPSVALPKKQIIAAVIGGLLLGYGARIAFGCNIGAYFSGIGSTSLHGWLWFLSAFVGSILGTKLRPWFDLN